METRDEFDYRPINPFSPRSTDIGRLRTLSNANKGGKGESLNVLLHGNYTVTRFSSFFPFLFLTTTFFKQEISMVQFAQTYRP